MQYKVIIIRKETDEYRVIDCYTGYSMGKGTQAECDKLANELNNNNKG